MTMRQLTASLTIALLGTFAVACENVEEMPTSALGVGEVEDAEGRPDISFRFFTGRDSFGVAMKMQIAGDDVTTAADGRCAPDVTVVLVGSGRATHLGTVDGMFSHCAALDDPLSIYGGSFHVTGATGGDVSGTYPALPTVELLGKSGNNDHENVITTKAAIDGGSIAAVQRAELEGRGDLRIVLKADGSFIQTFDGWLLHHLATD